VSLRGGNGGRPVGSRCQWGKSEGEGGVRAVNEVSSGQAMIFDVGPMQFHGRMQPAPVWWPQTWKKMAPGSPWGLLKGRLCGARSAALVALEARRGSPSAMAPGARSGVERTVEGGDGFTRAQKSRGW
jgi:hypothetical protein